MFMFNHSRFILRNEASLTEIIFKKEFIMKCKKEEFVEGAIFHLFNKTPKGKPLFKCDEDYLYFLEKFKKNIQKYPCKISPYCIVS